MSTEDSLRAVTIPKPPMLVAPHLSGHRSRFSPPSAGLGPSGRPARARQWGRSAAGDLEHRRSCVRAAGAVVRGRWRWGGASHGCWIALKGLSLAHLKFEEKQSNRELVTWWIVSVNPGANSLDVWILYPRTIQLATMQALNDVCTTRLIVMIRELGRI